MIRRPPKSTPFPSTPLFRSPRFYRLSPEEPAGRTRVGVPVVGDVAHVPVQPVLADLPLCHVLQRSEEHTSELQSQSNLVCRLLLEKKKTYRSYRPMDYSCHL